MTSSAELCASRAGPFRNVKGDAIGYLYIFLTVSSIFINAGLRKLVLGYWSHNWPLPSQYHDAARCAHCAHCGHTDNVLRGDTPPPLYSDSESTGRAAYAESQAKDRAAEAKDRAAAETKAAMAHCPSISRFALCTALAIINILTIVLLAFSIQSAIYCESSNIEGRDGTLVVLWILYTVSAAWALSGTLCWAIWLRNLLCGPETAEKWPIRPAIGLYIIGALISPMILAGAVAAVVGALAVMGVVGLTKGIWWIFGGKPSKKEEVIEVERGAGCASGNVIENDGGREARKYQEGMGMCGHG